MSEAKKLQIVGTFNPKEVGADKIIFPEGLNTTYAIGKVKLENGIGTLVEPGGTLEDFFNVFVDEIYPKTIQPMITAKKQYNWYNVEVGEYISPIFEVTLLDGSYSYNTETGVVATSCTVRGLDYNFSVTSSGHNKYLCVGDEFQVDCEGLELAEVEVSYTSGIIPVTNLGNEYPDGQIKAGRDWQDVYVYCGYRKMFYGSLAVKEQLTSDIIRGLKRSTDASLSDNPKYTVPVEEGAVRVVIALPESHLSISIHDMGNMEIEITNSFRRETIEVYGANNAYPIDYDVWILDFGRPNDKANSFQIRVLK